MTKEKQFECGFLSSGIWIGPGAKNVMPCCHVSKFGNRNSFEEFDSLINHPSLVAVRKEAAQGKIPSICNDCVSKEKDGLFSPRNKANKFFSNKGVVKEIIDYTDVEQIYVSLSNICNFKCVMCSGGQSHLIAKERSADSIRDPLLMVNDDKFEQFIDVIKKAKNLKNIQVTGGEPFQHKIRLRKLLEHLPKDIYFYMHTNGSFFDKETQELCKMMESFREASVIFSVDGYENSFEYQRTNGVWKDVLYNLEQFNKVIDTTKVKPRLGYTVTCFNVIDVVNFIKNYHYLFDRLDFHPIRKPEEYVIGMLNQDTLEKTYDELKNFLQNINDDVKNKIHVKEVLVNLENYINNNVSETNIEQFWKTAKYMTEVRGINLETKLPSLIKKLRTV